MASRSTLFTQIARAAALTTTLTVPAHAGGHRPADIDAHGRDNVQAVGVNGDHNTVKQHITKRKTDCSGHGNCDSSRTTYNRDQSYRDDSVKATAHAKVGDVGSNSHANVGDVKTGDQRVNVGSTEQKVNVAPAQQITTTNINDSSKFESDGRGLSGSVLVSGDGECSSGWGVDAKLLQFTGDGGSVGFGKTRQDKVCLSKNAAIALMNTGVVIKDNAMIATGVKSLAIIFKDINTAIITVSDNLMKKNTTCTVYSSPILLASTKGCTPPTK